MKKDFKYLQGFEDPYLSIKWIAVKKIHTLELMRVCLVHGETVF